MKFKIDLYQSSVYMFGVFVERKTFLSSEWVLINNFETRDAAKAFYEKIKDLPEYLN